MRNEVNGVMGSDLPTMQSIKKLPYTLAVIKETLRLFPPAQLIGKTCLKDTKMGPYNIKAGSRALVLTRELHRNKNIWGETANEFDPERFMPNSSNAPTHEYAWMPFSAGTRGCIGMQFSLIETRIILARIMQRQITFRLHQDAEVDEKFRTVSSHVHIVTFPRIFSSEYHRLTFFFSFSVYYCRLVHEIEQCADDFS